MSSFKILKMAATFDFTGTNLGEKLQLNREFCLFIASKIGERSLEESGFKLRQNGDLTVTLSYKLTKVNSTGHQRTTNSATSPSKSHCQINKHPVSSKKKTPSRRRRDRERFRAFLERKKQRKSLQVTTPVSDPVQCSPPNEVTVTVCDPPTVTFGEPPTAPTPAEPTVTPPCTCDVCSVFQDIMPFQEEYTACHNCGKAATEESPLKPCAQCLARAYCTRECQRQAWKAKHKRECDAKLGEQIRRARKTWNNCKEIWLEHKTKPVVLPTT